MAGDSLHSDGEELGRGFTLIAALIGLAAGACVYGIDAAFLENTTDDAPPLALTALTAVSHGALACLLILSTRAPLRSVGLSAAIALALAGPSYFLFHEEAASKMLSNFPFSFWFFLAAPVAFFVLTTFAKTFLEDSRGAGDRRFAYRTIFFHGLTTPLIAAGATFIAVLAFLLLTAWAALLRSLDVEIFSVIIEKKWFIFPFFAMITAISIALMRRQNAVLGALRFLLLLFSRIAMPITALFSVTFILVLIVNGTAAVFDRAYPGATMLALALTGMLIFNGVYQNGEGKPPPLWLRLSTIITLLALPVCVGLAGYALWLRVESYGLTPPRIAGLAITGLACAYGVVGLIGVLSEIRWRTERWMPVIAPLNTAMAIVWTLVLIALASPLAHPWAISARSQETLLLSERIDAEEFDFSYLKFRLGPYGARALDRIEAARDHPQAALIADEIARVRQAANRWEYQNPDRVKTEPAPAAAPETESGPETLDFNPADNPDIDPPELPQDDAPGADDTPDTDDAPDTDEAPPPNP